MAAPFGSTQKELVLGKLTNGLKLVHVELTITDGWTGETPVYVKSIQRILGWVIGFGKPATDIFYCSDDYVSSNAILIRPSADATNDVLQILAIGF